MYSDKEAIDAQIRSAYSVELALAYSFESRKK
jgi:hypothetical protein